VTIHEKYAAGSTNVLHLEDDLYIMQRGGYGGQPGLIYVLNNRGDRWNGAWANTQWHNTELVPVAWWSRVDMARPVTQRTEVDGRTQLYAGPRGYAVYVPKAW
jgi:alpha-amylase